MESWILLLTLLVVQQDQGATVEVKLEPIRDIASYNLCSKGGKEFVSNHEKIILETTTDWGEDKGEQPDADKFQVLRPVYTCIRVK